MSRTPDLTPAEHAAALAQLERLVDHHGSYAAAALVLSRSKRDIIHMLFGHRRIGKIMADRIAEAARQVTKHTDPSLARLGRWPAGEQGYRAAMLAARRAS